jgi:PAS domain-containing protein
MRMSERARGLDNIDQVIEQVRALARFPSENPNPVLRVSSTGRVLYANETANGVTGLLVGRGKDRLTKRVSDVAVKAAKTHKLQDVVYESADRAYAFVLAPVTGESYINLYGRDITEEREAARQVEDLAKFPSENTAPIFRVDSKGMVIYANEATHKVKGLVVGRGKDRVYKGLARIAEKVFRKKAREIVEFPSEGRVFALAVTPVPDRHYLNVYGAHRCQRASRGTGRGTDRLGTPVAEHRDRGQRGQERRGGLEAVPGRGLRLYRLAGRARLPARRGRQR